MRAATERSFVSQADKGRTHCWPKLAVCSIQSHALEELSQRKNALPVYFDLMILHCVQNDKLRYPPSTKLSLRRNHIPQAHAEFARGFSILLFEQAIEIGEIFKSAFHGDVGDVVGRVEKVADG